MIRSQSSKESSYFTLLFVILLLGSFYGYGQTHDIKFNLVSGANGILLGKVNSMTRDQYGAMWFSDQTNNCITRYDGTRMTRYSHNEKNTNSLGGTYPECLMTDSTGVLWIGFWGMGLDAFNQETNTFTHYRHDPNNPASLANDTISALLIDHLGNFWVGTNSGLDLFDPQTGTFTHFQHDHRDTTSLSYNFVRSIYEDKQGTLWVGTGFPWEGNDLGGLNKFNRQSRSFQRFLSDPDNPNSLINNKVRSLFEDSNGNFWIGTMGDGLHSLDRETDIITRHTFINDPEKIARPPVLDTYDHITFITEDLLGQLWLGTLSNGLLRYDPQTKRSTHYSNPINNASGFREKSSWTTYCGKDGLFWISTQSSRLYQVELFTNTIDFHPVTGGVRNFLNESPDHLLIGTYSGLIRKNIVDGSETVFLNDPTDNESIPNNDIITQYKDSKGRIWIGTPGGLAKFNPETKNFTRFLADPTDSAAISANIILSIREDKNSMLWIGTTDKLNRMDPMNSSFKKYKHIDGDSTSLSWNIVFDIMEDPSKDFLWLGIAANGVDVINKFDLRTAKVKAYQTGDMLSSTYQDKKGIVWAGGRNEIYQYSPEQDKFISLAEENIALKIPSVLAFAEDDEGNLWMGSNSTLYKLNKDQNKIISYGVETGIHHGAFEWKASHKLENGELLFGTTNGYYSFHPAKLIVPIVVPKIYLTEFIVNGVELTADAGGPIKKSLNKTETIILNHDQNIFSIGISLIDFSIGGENKIYFKLSNYDGEWKDLKGENNATYYNIPPGEYLFEILSANPTSGNTISKTISIIILPPWWKTWWGYSMFGLTFCGMAYSTHRIQRARVIRAERERTQERELAQAKEIEKAYHDLKITQSQLIQSEKMASLGELTAGIAHEIQNPLNFMNNFSEVNKELLEEMKEALDSGDANEAKTLATDVINNEEKINHHGKRADAIVKGMLQHSRGSSGEKELTDLNALCDEYLRLSYHGLRAKDKSFNAKFETNFDPSLPKINVVPQDIGRVVLNLINNAFYAVHIKTLDLASPQFEPTVTVSTKHLSTSGGGKGEVQITVKDNGPGIPDHIKEKIFQPFFTTKPTGQGTGLGLSLSYDIVKAHGGEIKVDSTAESGTSIIVKLPV